VVGASSLSTQCSGSVGWGAAAHSFMSEPKTRTVATTKAEKLLCLANALVSPELAAQQKRWFEE